jgi:hypothetical protein
MAQYVAQALSTASPQAVFDYLADFRTITDWDPSVTSATLEEGQAREVDSVYRVTLGVGPLGYPMTYRTIAAVTPEGEQDGRVELRAENANVISHDTITFTPDGSGGTVVEYRAELIPKGIRKVADPFFGLMIGFFGNRARGGLQHSVAALGETEKAS